MALVRLKNLCKSYYLEGQEIKALDGVNLDIEERSFVTVVGRSGCGKTTLLRVLSGLEQKTGGEMLVFDCAGEKVRTGIVFQEPRLMPWLNVKQNMVFSLKGCPGELTEHKADKYLNLLGLKEFANAYPSQISGGMAQRVALGRTLCYEPSLLLLDEPLSALDAFTRRRLQQEILEIYRLEKLTAVFVTHDVEEAVYLGRKVVIMDQGRVLDEISVNLPYPRDPCSGAFTAIKEKILDLVLRREQAIFQIKATGGESYAET